MELVYNWLKSYLNFTYTAEELAHELTMLGLEVEGIDYLGEGIEEIIIGEIVEITEHPNADKLVICQVNIAKEVLKIVTGASNVRVGAKVAVATIGVSLPNGLTIKKAKLRGESSYGMLCSSDELALSDTKAKGIMILDEKAEVGTKLIDYLGLNDYVLKLDLTPNYARCLGLLGIARELAAITGQKVNYPEFELEEKGEAKLNELIKVELVDEDLCPRYTGRIIENVKIGPSPKWMQKRLKAAGIRPINNVVDITNYVLLEYNQPLHAFDYDKIAGKKIIVRRANNNEKLITLDEKERKLEKDMLVIADAEKSVGLAGVMGGANTEVSETTKTIFLEAAYFNPVNIRKTARGLNLPSEASRRFERGIDIEGVLAASARAAYLMEKYTAAKVVPGVIDIYPHQTEKRIIKLNTEYVNRVLGLDLEISEIKGLLEKLEFLVVKLKEDLLEVEIPSYRNDVERQADLIEEVARMYGYNNIPTSNSASKQPGSKTYKQKLEDLSRNLMIAAGLDEVITFSLTSEASYSQLDIPEEDELRSWVRVKNPLNEAFSLMRTSLIPGLLEVLSNNARRQLDKMAIFEIGKIFFAKDKGERPLEKTIIAGASMGFSEDIWQNQAADFFYLKGILSRYLQEMGLENIKYEEFKIPYLHPGRTARILFRDKEIGFIGELLPDIISKMDLKERTSLFHLDFNLIVEESNLTRTYCSLPRHPAVERDMAILVDEEINAGDILTSIKNIAANILKEVKVFDLYQGDQIPSGLKSLAFQLLFQAEERTLTDEEVTKVFTKILNELKEKYQAEIRGI